MVADSGECYIYILNRTLQVNARGVGVVTIFDHQTRERRDLVAWWTCPHLIDSILSSVEQTRNAD